MNNQNIIIFFLSSSLLLQDKGGCSIDGQVIDRFIESGAGYRYLHARNEAPGAAKGKKILSIAA